jgi:hypothetical protein
VPPFEPPGEPPASHRALLGIYGEPTEGLLMRVEWRDGKLTVLDPDEKDFKLVLLPTDDPMRFTVDWFQRESGEPVAFHRDGDDRVTGVTIGPYSLQRFEPIGEPAVPQ